MLDNIYRIFMFVLPYAVSVAAYVWVGRKALRSSNKMTRALALAIIAGGLAYTVYRAVSTFRTMLANENFEYVVLIVMVAVLALASIIMAIGEPEVEPVSNRREAGTNPSTPGNDRPSARN